MQLHSNLFPEFGCDGELIELPERSTQMITVKRCAKCWTEHSWVADDEHRVTVVFPGMKGVHLKGWRCTFYYLWRGSALACTLQRDILAQL